MIVHDQSAIEQTIERTTGDGLASIAVYYKGVSKGLAETLRCLGSLLSVVLVLHLPFLGTSIYLRVCGLLLYMCFTLCEAIICVYVCLVI